MIRKSRIYLTLLLSIFLLPVAVVSEDMLWSKMKIEKDVEGKVHEVMSRFLKQSQYLLDIKLFLKDKGAEAKDSGFKLTDNEKPSEDYILFDKLGIEVPITGGEDAGPDRELDITKYFSKLTINIYVDEKIEKEKVDKISEVVKKVKYLSGVEETVEISQIPILIDGDTVEEVNQVVEILTWFSKFSNSLGFILAAILIGFFSTKVFDKYAAVKDKEMELMKTLNDPEKDSGGGGASGGGASGGGGGASGGGAAGGGGGAVAGEGGAAGGGGGGGGTLGGTMVMDENEVLNVDIGRMLGRFVNMIEHAPEGASSLIKKWLRLNTTKSKAALILLARELDSQSLMELFDNLTQEERMIWNNIIGEVMSERDFKHGALFVNSQVIGEVIIQKEYLDDDIKMMIAEMDPFNSAKMVNNNIDMGAVMMNLVSPTFIISMLKHIEDEKIEELTQKSAAIDDSYIESNLEAIRQQIKKYNPRSNRTPFIERVVEIIPDVGYKNEDHFINTLSIAGEEKLLRELLDNFIPSSLILELPDDVMKVVYQAIPREDLVRYVAIIEDDHRQRVMETFGDETNKFRQMIEIELENVMNDEVTMKRLEKEVDAIWMRFINLSRHIVAKNPAFKDQIDLLKDEWIEKSLAEFMPEPSPEDEVGENTSATAVADINELKEVEDAAEGAEAEVAETDGEEGGGEDEAA